jgi:ankyrin repeat protein
VQDNVFHLHSAIRAGSRGLFEQILEQSNDPCMLVNQGDDFGRTAMHVAVLSSDTSIVSRLLATGAAVNAQDIEGETPLHMATNAKMSRVLLDKAGANPNIPNIDGICALHLAVQRRNIETVRSLLKRNANVNNADNIRWFTPLHLVALPARHSLDVEVSPDMGSRIALLLTSQLGASEPDLNYQDREGNTPLHYAVQLDNPDACVIIRIFVEKGADPNVCNERSQSPLHLLCHNEYLRDLHEFHDALDCMLYHGANPNLQSLTGCTPLHLSLYHRDIGSAVQLVSRGAELHLLWKKVSRSRFAKIACCCLHFCFVLCCSGFLSCILTHPYAIFVLQ